MKGLLFHSVVVARNGTRGIKLAPRFIERDN